MYIVWLYMNGVAGFWWGFKQNQCKLASCGVVRTERNAVLIVKLCYGFSSILCMTEHKRDSKLQNAVHQRCSHLCGSGHGVPNVCVYSSDVFTNFSVLSDLLPVCYSQGFSI